MGERQMDEIKKFRSLIETNWPDYEDLLKKVIAVQSVKGEPQPGSPFGAPAREVLNMVLEQAKAWGFETGVVNDAVGYAQWSSHSKTKDYIGVLGHLDVVAADGQGWLSKPFELDIRDGKYYGRGVLDNKGPILTCLYGLKLLKDSGFEPEKTIRIMFGTDEESGASDIALYLEKESAPTFGFTPDGKFPVVYGERGVVAVELITGFNDLSELSDFDGEMAKDFVPNQLAIKFKGIRFESEGLRSPSNAPEMGKNALTGLAAELSEKLPESSIKSYFTWLAESLHNQHYGEGIGLNLSDEASGRLIITPYLIKKVGNKLRLELSIRYPVSVTEKEVLERLSAHLFENTEMKIVRRLKGTMNDVTFPEIQEMSKIYERVTGLDGRPVTTTGATYARFMPNIVAFGPSFPGQKGIAHKENEYIIISDLKQMTVIYMCTMKALIEKSSGESKMK